MAYHEIVLTTQEVTDSHDTAYLDGDYMEIVLEETTMDMDDLDCDYPTDEKKDMDDPECDYLMDEDPVVENTEEYYDTVEQPKTEMDIVQDEVLAEMCDVEELEKSDVQMMGTEVVFCVQLGIFALQMLMSWIQSQE